MRARNIKPGFFENEELAELSFESRLLFIGLWCYADKEGRFEWRPKRIKALLFPYDRVNVETLLSSLAEKNFIFKYSDGGFHFGAIPNFAKHQNPHPHEAKSILPIPPSQTPARITSDEQTQLSTIPNSESNQCHDMSLLVTKCNADSLIPDSLIPDSNTLSGGNGKPPATTPPFREIIEYLNLKSGKRFKHDSEETRKLIRARWHKGYRLPDFKAVIDKKCAKWLIEPKMVDFVRPVTLFGSKFESYLNEIESKPRPVKSEDDSAQDWY